MPGRQVDNTRAGLISGPGAGLARARWGQAWLASQLGIGAGKNDCIIMCMCDSVCHCVVTCMVQVSSLSWILDFFPPQYSEEEF